MFKYRTLSLAVIASWAFVAGYLQNKQNLLDKFYKLVDNAGDNIDPLNGKAMAKAKHPKLDSDTYRGLGTRTNDKERGRLTQFFYRYSKSKNPKISLAMYNEAIKYYHVNKESDDIKKTKSAF